MADARARARSASSRTRRGIGLEALGVKLDNARPRHRRRPVASTNVPGIYAIGDVIGGGLPGAQGVSKEGRDLRPR
jgi:pyruvate/2-oxoglutarate dehydrogenase complex dihydrolipoamide dehydrogenase (E3) component